MQEILQNYPKMDPIKIFVLYESRSDYRDEYQLQHYPVIQIDNFDGKLTVKGYLGVRFESDASGIPYCNFFDKIQKNCTIHNHKPWICCAYPHTFNDCQTLCFGKGRCPSKWMYDTKDLPRITEFIRNAFLSYKDFKIQVKRWNESVLPRTFENLLQFISNLNFAN
jgi:Fe-S-cluster containining protein